VDRDRRPRAGDVTADHNGGHRTVENAHLVTPDADAVTRYRESGGGAKTVQAGTKVCYGADEAACRATALRLWPNEAMPGELPQILPTPAHFQQTAELVTEDAVASSVACGPDIELHVQQIQSYVDAGVDELYIQQIGAEHDAFFDVFSEQVLPRFSDWRTARTGAPAAGALRGRCVCGRMRSAADTFARRRARRQVFADRSASNPPGGGALRGKRGVGCVGRHKVPVDGDSRLQAGDLQRQAHAGRVGRDRPRSRVSIVATRCQRSVFCSQRTPAPAPIPYTRWNSASLPSDCSERFHGTSARPSVGSWTSAAPQTISPKSGPLTSGAISERDATIP
jgi:hypothetical protein